MKHLKRFKLNEDNTTFMDIQFEVPIGESKLVDISDIVGKVVIDIKYNL